KDLGCADWEQREIDHSGSPQVAVRSQELEPKATPGIGRVSHVGLPAIQGEASNYRHTTWFKYGGTGGVDAISIALEQTGHPNPLRVIAPEPGMETVDRLESIGELVGRRLLGIEQSAGVWERSSNCRQGEANQGQLNKPSDPAVAPVLSAVSRS